jgi:hypothetical protein
VTVAHGGSCKDPDALPNCSTRSLHDLHLVNEWLGSWRAEIVDFGGPTPQKCHLALEALDVIALIGIGGPRFRNVTIR